MVTAHAQEVSREIPQSKEAYLRSFESEWEKIHEGVAPETGLKEKGNPERKKICEDVKLKCRKMGLFLVADGVSSANGWYASRETARVMYEMLGEELDHGVENNIQHALRTGSDPLKHVTEYVMGQMVAAIEQAHIRIRAKAAGSGEFFGAATTLSLVKLVELPDTNRGRLQRLFFTNVGDSRIYVQREGRSFEQVTRDDSMLEKWVDEGEITPQEAQIIDQAPDPQRLEKRLYDREKKRNIITKAIGLYKPTENLSVSYIDLQPGDRFVIVSDGVSDQMLTQRIGRTVEGYQDDEQAEEVLQQEALQMSLDGRDPRSKGDDISALVKTIEERGPDRLYLRPEAKQVQTRESLKDTFRDVRLRVEHARQEVHQLQQELSQLDSLTPKRERLALMVKLEKAQEHEATYRYHLEKTHLDIVDFQVPPRFQTGEQVDVWREDFDPPSLDRQSWTVISYDDQSKEYTVRGASRATKRISRYKLENLQSGLLVQLGDELPAVNEIGVLEKGFKIIAFDPDGNAVMAKETDQVIKRVRVKAENVNETFLGQLYVAEQAYHRMEQATQAYHKALERQKSLQDEAESIERIESRQRALDAARTKG